MCVKNLARKDYSPNFFQNFKKESRQLCLGEIVANLKTPFFVVSSHQVTYYVRRSVGLLITMSNYQNLSR